MSTQLQEVDVDEIQFTLSGKPYTLSRKQLLEALKGQTPGRIQTYAVDIDGIRWPVKQVVASALRVPAASFVSTQARSVLRRLEFTVINVEDEDVDQGAQPSVRALALELAVALHARRDVVTDSVVLATATSFEGWLAG